jgi:hypothetical protein
MLRPAARLVMDQTQVLPGRLTSGFARSTGRTKLRMAEFNPERTPGACSSDVKQPPVFFRFRGISGNAVVSMHCVIE